MGKKILLIRAPPADWRERHMESWPPVSIMSIAWVLKEAGIPVEIIDFHVLWNEREQQALENILSSDEYLLVGISTMTVEVRLVPHVRDSIRGLHYVMC